MAGQDGLAFWNALLAKMACFVRALSAKMARAKRVYAYARRPGWPAKMASLSGMH